MLTANVLDDLVIEALDAGANDYVTKPFSYPVLAARMRTLLRMKSQQEELERMNKILHQLSIADPLTGLSNRRHFFEYATAEVCRSKRYSHTMALMMLDIDHFKHVNDTYGHATGDEVLIGVAKLVQKNMRESDLAARFGGEEFIAFLPETEELGAEVVAERIRQEIESTEFIDASDDSVKVKVTISIGLYLHKEGETGDISDFMKLADIALYEAKESGRNKVIVYQDSK